MNELFVEQKEIFLDEAREYIALLNDNLIALEKEPQNTKLINNIFRVFHTLKSSVAVVGLQDISILFHKAEDIMQQIRSGEYIVTTDIISLFFEVLDFFQNYVEYIKEDKVPPVNVNILIQKLESFHAAQSTESETTKKDENENITDKTGLTEYDLLNISRAYEEGQKCYILKAAVEEQEPLKWLRADILINNVLKYAKIIKIIPDKEKFHQKNFSGVFSLILSVPEETVIEKDKIIIDLIKSLDIEEFNPREIPQPAEKQGQGISCTEEINSPAEGKEFIINDNNPENSKFKIKSTGDTIRVGIRKLDNLMNLIGELVIITSGVKQIEQNLKNDLINKNIFNKVNIISNKLTNISSELQNGIMETRMLPISNIFHQFSRVVRDLAKEEKKEVDLILKGEDTELDKKIIDEIGEPLMHLVRNAVDHAISTPDERRQSGKPEKGTITLSAGQISNHIEISIKDDGDGLDVDKIKAKALHQGLATEEKLNSMDEREIYDFIFMPGFSTTEKITSVSGRGVGLDIVKNAINSLGGSVDVFSKKGKGTEFMITIPLTLAITSVILFESNNIVFAIPINDINETLKIKPQEIKTIEGYKAFNLRNSVLPMINLAEVFHEKIKTDWHTQKRIPVIVVTYQNKKIGLIIDKILHEQEIVIKPLERHYRSIKGLSGAAILGDGIVVLVIDIIGVIKIMKGIELIASDHLEAEAG